jgi:hypothetical protein
MSGYHIYSNWEGPPDRPYVYLVDMMLAYVNIFKPPSVDINVADLEPQLKDTNWSGTPVTDILPKITLKKYEDHHKRIMDADLSYPIFVRTDHDLIDGAHRLCKAILTGKKTIKAYVFSKSLMKKFIIHEGMKDGKVDNAGAGDKKLYEILMLFHKRFC